MQNIDPEIFKTYDIRGIYPDEIDEEATYKIGRAFIKFLENKGEINNRQIVVGRDSRLSSDSLAESLIQGLQSSEADVIDIGQVSTPLFYWAVIKEEAAGGLMVTASHNPANFNGLKVCLQKGVVIGSETGLFQIRDMAQKIGMAPMPATVGKIIKKNLLPQYLDFVLSQVDINSIKPLKIIVDCGNGTAGPEVTPFFQKLPCRAEILFVEPDGSFPNHEPNPLKEENLETLREKLLVSNADLGMAFDGDSDRVIFLDEKGRVVRGDFITVILAGEMLKEYPGQKILFEVRSSRIVPEFIVKNGGVPVLGRAGHSLMKAQMRQENIVFGGELSGHYFFKNLGFMENTLFVVLKILQILSREAKPLSEIIAPLEKYFSSGEVNFVVTDPDNKLREIEQRFSDAQIKKIDGITVEYPDWWFNLRKSNTEPLVRLNLETDSAQLLEEKKKELFKLLSE